MYYTGVDAGEVGSVGVGRVSRWVWEVCDGTAMARDGGSGMWCSEGVGGVGEVGEGGVGGGGGEQGKLGGVGLGVVGGASWVCALRSAAFVVRDGAAVRD